jgi:predicted GIY-YIG superfamily endonuclease
LPSSSLKFWVYVLENGDGRFYVGQTDDLDRRLTQHNELGPSKGKYTLKNGPWKLAWSEQHGARSSALKRERDIKRMKSARWIRELLLNRQSESRRATGFIQAR